MIANSARRLIAGVATGAVIASITAATAAAHARDDRYVPGPQQGTVRDLDYRPGQDLPPGVRFETFEEALAAEASLLAEEHRVPTEQAERGLLAQNEFGIWLADLVEEYPNVAHSRMSPVTGSAEVWFAGGAPADLELPPSVDVTVHSGARWSEDDATEVQTAASKVLTEAGIPHHVLSTDAVVGTLHVEVAPDDLDHAVALAGTFDFIDAARTTVSTTDADLGSVDSRGGGRISRDQTGPNVQCTTGFSATRGGIAGKSTAGHCSAYTGIHYYRPSSTTYLRIYWGPSHMGTWGDFWWGDVDNDTAVPEFYASHTLRRTVGATANASVGNNLCNYGRARDLSSIDCALVTATDVTVSGISRLVEVGEDNAIAGDSGGPWYSLNTAYGIHSRSSCGGACVTDLGESWFSAVRLLDQGVGAYVMVG